MQSSKSSHFLPCTTGIAVCRSFSFLLPVYIRTHFPFFYPIYHSVSFDLPHDATKEARDTAVSYAIFQKLMVPPRSATMYTICTHLSFLYHIIPCCKYWQCICDSTATAYKQGDTVLLLRVWHVMIVWGMIHFLLLLLISTKMNFQMIENFMVQIAMVVLISIDHLLPTQCSNLWSACAADLNFNFV